MHPPLNLTRPLHAGTVPAVSVARPAPALHACPHAPLSPQAASAAASAARYYQRFLASFRGEGGALPDRVDTDNEPYFLMASFGLGRMLHRMRGTGAGAVGAAAGGGAKGGKGAQEDARWGGAEGEGGEGVGGVCAWVSVG